MADTLRLHVGVDGQRIAVPGLDGSSAMLPGDVDVWPRDTGLEIALPREEDRRHFNQILAEKSWPSIEMTPSLDQGDLVYRCASNTWLPAGIYSVRLSIAGLGSARDLTVTVTDGPGEIAQLADFTSDPRRVVLSALPAAWDPLIRRLVLSPASIIDGRQAADWIVDDSTSPQRRACALNLFAKLRTVPSVQSPIITGIDSILGLQLERMYVRVSPDLSDSPILANGDLFKREGTPADAIHKLLQTWIKTRQRQPEASAVQFQLTSYRQAVTRNSMQMVFAVPNQSTVLQPPATAPGCYADLDIDLGGSLTDIVGFVIHMGELAGNPITDHLDLHARLATDGDSFARNFLYYDVK